jgi:hypothetical protein
MASAVKVHLRLLDDGSRLRAVYLGPWSPEKQSSSRMLPLVNLEVRFLRLVPNHARWGTALAQFRLSICREPSFFRNPLKVFRPVWCVMLAFLHPLNLGNGGIRTLTML